MSETNLQKKRLEAGLSQSKLAEKSGISIRTLQSLEIGKRDIKKTAVATVIALADALECDIKEII